MEHQNPPQNINKDKLSFLHNLLDKELEIIKEVSPYKNQNQSHL